MICGLVAGSADSGETASPQIQDNRLLRPTVSITQSTRRGSSAIWVNVGTFKDHNDAFANPGEVATESLGRATAAVVFRGDTQRSSQVVGTTSGTNRYCGMLLGG